MEPDRRSTQYDPTREGVGLGASPDEAIELGEAIEWAPVDPVPALPPLGLDRQPWELIESLTDYYLRTIPETGETFAKWIPPGTDLPDGTAQQGGFLFPNLAVPALLDPLVAWWDRLDAQIEAAIKKGEWIKIAGQIAKYGAPWTAFFDTDPLAAAGAIKAEHARWLERKAKYVAQIRSAKASDPWQPTGLSEPVLDPLFVGWYPPGSNRYQGGIKSLPDVITPVLIWRVIDGSIDAWKANLAQFAKDLKAAGKGAAAASVGRLVAALEWALDNPIKALAIVGAVGVGGLLAVEAAKEAAREVVR
jgi:hypothetical protein